MKVYRIIILASAAATSLIALPVIAQTQDIGRTPSPALNYNQPAGMDPAADSAVPSTEKRVPNQNQSGKLPGTEVAPFRASDIIGMEVQGSEGHTVGTVRDLLVDLKDGSIAEVVVGPGSFIRTEDKLQAIPPSCFAYSPSARTLRVKFTRDDLASAPTFNMARWREDAADPAKLNESYDHFHINARSFGNGDVERASLVMGSAVRNDQDERLGRVENLIIDLPQARIEKVVLSSGGFLGIDSELTAFAPSAFAYSPDSDRLTLNMTPDAVKDAPHFKASEWMTVINTSSTSPGTAMPNGSSVAKSDSAITSEIQQKLRSENSLSENGRNIVVSTHDGQVTLRGTVDTQYDHQRAGEVAATVVPSDKVDNQTLISTSPVAGNPQR